jgi:hypothetical protein
VAPIAIALVFGAAVISPLSADMFGTFPFPLPAPVRRTRYTSLLFCDPSDAGINLQSHAPPQAVYIDPGITLFRHPSIVSICWSNPALSLQVRPPGVCFQM